MQINLTDEEKDCLIAAIKAVPLAGTVAEVSKTVHVLEAVLAKLEKAGGA